jgi:release factor glutamine methyltransferase
MQSLVAKLLMPALLWRMRRHRHAYDVSYRGETVTVLPDVFSPRYDRFGRVAIDCLPALAGKSFIEVGCGCGIVSVFAAIGGARLVVATDISPLAARNTKFNFDARRLTNALVVQGDVLEAISYKFDYVLFNPPFYDAPPQGWLEQAIFDEGYLVLKRFIADVRRCLAANGRVFLGFPRGGDERMLHTELQQAGLEVEAVKKFGIRGFGGTVYTLRAS